MYIHVYIRMYIYIFIECHEWFDQGKYEQERNSLVAICDLAAFKTHPQRHIFGSS